MMHRVLWKNTKWVPKGQWTMLVVGSFLLGWTILGQGFLTAKVLQGFFLENWRTEDAVYWMGGLLACMIFRFFLHSLTDVAGANMAAYAKNRLRERLTQQMIYHMGNHRLQEQTGRITHILGDGLEELDSFFARYLPSLLQGILLPFMVLIIVLAKDIVAGGVLLITAPLLPFFLWLIGKMAEHASQKQWKVLRQLTGHFFDVVTGFGELRIFGRSQEQVAVLDRLSGKLRKSTLQVLRVAFLSAFILELMATLGTAMVAVALGLQLLYDKIDFMTAFAILLLAPEFYLPLRGLGLQFHSSLAAKTLLEEVERLFHREESSIVQRTLEKVREISADREIGFNKANVPLFYLDDVWCGSVDKGFNSWILKGIHMEIMQGEMIAIMGLSGAGKSSLLSLLLGWEKPVRGKLLIKGSILDSVGDWWEQIAWLPQIPTIFPGTIQENICLGMPLAEATDVEKAAKEAGIDEFIRGLPEGYDTYIGEGGRWLSGGEKQRIAIARVFLKNAPVVLIDEPSAGLDPFAAAVVAEAVAAFRRHRTVIVAAHQLHTVRMADKIVFLEEGQLVQYGKPQVLAGTEGPYRKMLLAAQGGQL